MAIGERIRFIRDLRGMTQKYLGTLVGFPEKTARYPYGAIRGWLTHAEGGSD